MDVYTPDNLNNKNFMKRILALFCAYLLIGVHLAIAQTLQVTGTVISGEDGQPIIGASVVVEGTKTGVTTNVEGKFTLRVDKNAKLKISYIGMQTQVLKAQATMKITLYPDAMLIDEVVVTGMQKMDKRMFTGATAKVDADKVKLDGMADISRSLEGRIAGVSVQNVSGTFGTAPKIRVRGATSIYGSSKPLWVVDGVIIEDAVDVGADDLSSGDAETLISSAIAGLNADDIESFQILKDGSATSIYGARAMAGVIVVTTKKGRAGHSSINYTGEFTMRMKPSYNEFNIMNSQDQMGVYDEMEKKGWLNAADLHRASDSGVYGYMYKLMNTYDPATGQYALPNTPDAINAYKKAAEMRNTDWFDLLFSNAVSQNHSVSISTGTEKASFYASLSALTDPGWYKQSEVKRYTANLNTTYNISEKLSVGLIANASYRKQKAPGTLSATVDAASGEVTRDFDLNPYSYALNSSRALDPHTFYTANYAPFNILHELDHNNMELNIVDLRFQSELKYKPIRGLELSALAAIKYQTTSQEHNILDDANQAIAYRTGMDDATIRDANDLLYKDPDYPYALPISILPDGGIYQRRDYKMAGWDFRATANWNKAWGADERHLTNLFAGMEVNSLKRSNSMFRGWGMQYSLGELPSYVYQFFKKGIEADDKYYSLSHTMGRAVAAFMNATYSYDGRYTLNGTFRYEGTNRMGSSRSARWLPTWNIAGKWSIDQESFFEPLRPAFSSLALRLSYSLTADRGPTWVNNSTATIYPLNPWRGATEIREPALSISAPENSELTYEKKHELNVGLDMGFLDDRITLSMDAYRRNNFDLIGNVVTMGLGGAVDKQGNVAEMKSQGVELSLFTRNIERKNFKWQTNFIFAWMDNEVTKLKTMTRMIDYITGTGYSMEGTPRGSLFSLKFKGLNEMGIPTFLAADGSITSTNIQFQETVNMSNLVYEGPVDPTITGSLGNIFKWKGFTLNLFMTYSFGNVVRLDPIFSNGYSDLTAMPREFANRYLNPGDERRTNVPVIASTRQNNDISNLYVAYSAYNYSDVRVAKGDFIRMKEISLSYDFPQSVSSKLRMSGLSLKFQATNPFLIYSDKKLQGQDPEFFNTGGVAVPMPKQFTLTLRVSF